MFPPIPLLLLLPLTAALQIPLPPGVQIEGITHARGTNYLAADFRTSTIYLIDTSTGLVTPAIPSLPNRTANGLHLSPPHLLVAGGGTFPVLSAPTPPAPALHVYHLATALPIASCRVPGAFVDDVIARKRFAYFTDALAGAVFRLSLAALPACRVAVIPLPRPFFAPRPPVLKANGIVPFAGGLVVSHTTLNTLFFIDLRNDNAGQQILPADAVPGADGMQIVRTKKGRVLLYVAQYSRNVVSVWRLRIRKRKVSAVRLREISSPDFDFPTTVAVSGKTVVVANAQFDKAPPTEPLPPGFVASVGVVHL